MNFFSSMDAQTQPPIVELSYPSLPHGLVYLVDQGLQDLSPVESPRMIPLSCSIRPIGQYASPIALMVAKSWNDAPQAIASHLKAKLIDNLKSSYYLDAQDLQIESDETGWLRFRCSPSLQLDCLATVFQDHRGFKGTNFNKTHFNKTHFNKTYCDRATLSNAPSIVELQYAHACCSGMLRLARSQTRWQGNSKKLLNFEALSRFSPNSAEQQLWRSLLNFPLTLIPSQRIMVDGPYDSFNPSKSHAAKTLWIHSVSIPWPLSNQTCEQLATEWAKVFQLVYRQCRILGESAQRSPQIQTHRIGLILLLQRVLESLLTQVFDVEAPESL